MKDEPTHIDLFSGIGGFAIAAQAAGFRAVAFCEIEPYCQALLQERFGAVMADADQGGSLESKHGSKRRTGMGSQQFAGNNAPRIHSDIRTLDGTRYRGAALLTGGFPCQPFSVAGKRAGAADNRFLWPEMLRVVSEARPAWILGENVPGIVPMELDRVLSDLEGIGYACWPLVIPACAVDARHRRDRVWIVANTSERRFGGQGSREAQQPRRAETISRGEALADADQHNGHRRCGTMQMGRNGSTREAARNGDASRTERLAQSILGGMVDGVSRWMDEPADLPRVIKGTTNRVHRLKGLGNAIVSAVAYELLRTIRELI